MRRSQAAQEDATIGASKSTPTSRTSSEAQGSQADRAAQGDRAQQSFVNLLARTLGEANRFLTIRLRRAGLEGLVPSHGDVLLCLFSEGPVSMQKLAEAAHRDPSTVTALVKKLVSADYVRTDKSEADHRVTMVSLTEKGTALRTEFETISAALVEAQMRGVNEKTFLSTCETLDRIRGNFAKACEDASLLEGDER